MSDLENTLAELIERETPVRVPPFVDIRRRARVRSRRRMIAGAVAFVLAVGLGSVVAVGIGSGRAPVADLPVDGPAPQRITHQGVDLELTGELPLHEVWIDRSDRSTLVVEAGHNGGCGPFPVVRILTQDARTVRIGAYGYEPVDWSHAANTVCPAVFNGYTQHPLKLGAPVQGRTVLNGAVTVAVRDPATILGATYLPPGYSGPGSLDWGLPLGVEDRPGVYAERLYRGSADDHVFVRSADPDAERVLNSLAGQPSLFGPVSSFDVEARPTVRGYDAVLFSYSTMTRCVRWREPPVTAVVVCSSRTAGALPAADVLAVAEGLRPGA